LTVILTLMVFIGRLPGTIRRVRAQREALRPLRPIARTDHLPCIVNTIGATITEFFQLGLLTFGVFIGSYFIFGTLEQAPTFTTGMRHISLSALVIMMALAFVIGILLIGGAIARYALALTLLFAVIAWMVESSVGDEWPAVLIFALLSCGAPTALVLLIRRLF
jgi:sterol desaturase/sphingolipid hydroxylase (fatty acid hydroxylase superfamily)